MCSWRKGRLKDCLERNGSVEGGAGIMFVFFLMRIRVQFCCNFSEQEQKLIDCVLIRCCNLHMLWLHVSENYALN